MNSQLVWHYPSDNTNNTFITVNTFFYMRIFQRSVSRWQIKEARRQIQSDIWTPRGGRWNDPTSHSSDVALLTLLDPALVYWAIYPNLNRRRLYIHRKEHNTRRARVCEHVRVLAHARDDRIHQIPPSRDRRSSVWSHERLSRAKSHFKGRSPRRLLMSGITPLYSPSTVTPAPRFHDISSYIRMIYL